MEKLAELSSDKEQLEHLVERLQEETDTIGDYVIMYQHQRKQQRIKIQEKEQEVCISAIGQPTILCLSNVVCHAHNLILS